MKIVYDILFFLFYVILLYNNNWMIGYYYRNFIKKCMLEIRLYMWIIQINLFRKLINMTEISKFKYP